jgi:hypothetical protein
MNLLIESPPPFHGGWYPFSQKATLEKFVSFWFSELEDAMNTWYFKNLGSKDRAVK